MGNATNVIPSAEIDFGLVAEAGIGSLDADKELTLVSVVKTLPTACLLWDKDAGTLADATKVVAASSSAASASSASASAASASATQSASAHGNAGARLGYAEGNFLGTTLGFTMFCMFGFLLW